MFDPFLDFNQQGYLRNTLKEKDLYIVKRVEHLCAKANYPKAINYLFACKNITYDSFLEVHKLLLQDFYPWAGKDRLTTSSDMLVSKGNILFAYPDEMKEAVNEGLRIAEMNLYEQLANVLGYFAYAHPFLDGNGRSIFLVFDVLCQRFGIQVNWGTIDEKLFLEALTEELLNPDNGRLNSLMHQHIKWKD